MSQVPTDPSVMQLFTAFDDRYSKSKVDTGQGFLGEWPPAGDWMCSVTDISLNKAQQKRTGKDGQVFDGPGVEVQFHFRCNDVLPGKLAEEQQGGFEWKGKPMFIPANPAAVPASLDWMFKDGERLKGHLRGVLGVASGTSLQADIMAALAAVKSTNVVCNVRCQYDKGKVKADAPAGTQPPEYKQEFIIAGVTR